MNIPKIKDRVFLGIIVGTIANLPKILIDEISQSIKISQRSFRETAAGVWVSNQNQAASSKGQLLGHILDFGMAMFGGIQMVNLFSKTGKDHVVAKGLFLGIGMGSAITGIMSGLPTNKVRPKDAASNLSYVDQSCCLRNSCCLSYNKFGSPIAL